MMSRDWAQQQQGFAAALLDPHAPTPDCVQARQGAQPEARFDVYRNNVHASLVEALLATFPVTARLVSEDSFRALARDFLRVHLPARAALHDYGDALAHFLRTGEAAASPAYLPDVAALEHAWWQAYGAAEAPVLSLHDIAAMPGEDLLRLRARLHPAVRLLQSAHPVYTIWAAHQGVGSPAPPRTWQAENVLITRPQAEVQVRCTGAGAHAFLAGLPHAALEDAAAAALDIDPAFELGHTLQLAIEAGAIEELHA